MAPDGWQETPVRKLLKDQTPGYWGSSLDDEEEETGTVVLRATNISDDGVLDLSDVAYRDVPARKIEQKRLRPGDILLENSGGGPNKPVGRVAIFEERGLDEVLPTNFLRRLRPDPDRVDPRFLLYLLWHFHKVGGTKAFQHQTTGIRNLDYRGYLAWEHPIPPLPEQRKIAAILSSVDDAIAATRKVIEQTRRVKKGLLQTLITRGIGHTRFKQTEIGEIPEEWEVSPLDEVARVQTGVAKNSSRAGAHVELPYIRVANVQDGHLDLGEVKTIRVPEGKVERYLLRDGDVLLTEGGDYDKLGRGHIWRGQIDPCVHQNHVFVVRTDSGSLIAEFLNALTSSSYGKRYFLSCAKQTTNLASINATQLRKFPVLLAPMSEQERIVQLLGAVDEVRRHQERMSRRLNTLKRGLLQDLLTGRVRVQPD